MLRAVALFALVFAVSSLDCQTHPGASATQTQAPNQTVVLWPQGAPGAKGNTPADRPYIDIYLPAANSTRTAVIVCPGGGYRFLAADYEGSGPAQFLVQHGVAAIVLHYRVTPYRHPAPLEDATRAMRYVRLHASDLGINSGRIGIWGFSAGAHLASTLATHFDAGNSGAPAAIYRVSSRPDFLILAYPVISMLPPYAHGGSRQLLLGAHPAPALAADLSTGRRVTRETPPTFIFSTSDDEVVKVANSILFYEACIRAHVPVEIHIFQHGRHGLGLAQDEPEVSEWPGLLLGWMRLNGWLSVPK